MSRFIRETLLLTRKKKKVLSNYLTLCNSSETISADTHCVQEARRA